ncbi:uncharacterized protein LOC103505157 [Diaphorina citri]|uniref:Uncharacterized protein LOC103505157 n=1 Tax=Diaphorina citri TaxID=121845 RepID=A0A3Q0IJC0_DIACI|nr:uncharacterized protein LOC103505157 [Diaphorina citri]
MPLLYVTIFLILYEEIRCDDLLVTVTAVVPDLNSTCAATPDCSKRLGTSWVCTEGVCVCKTEHYRDGNNCTPCSEFQESCEVSQCCLFAKVTACIDNVCKCKHNKDQTEFSACWNSARQSLGTQNILSFAKLILGAILALSLAALFGILRQLCNRPEVIESSAFQRSFPYESFNSIQRYVMQKLKDRPPRYEDIQKECGGSPSPSSSQGGAAGPRSGRGAPSNLPPSEKGARRNDTKHEPEVDRTGYFNLTLLYTLNDTEFERNYFKIINSLQKMGPEALRLINRTDLLESAFVVDSRENAADLKVRWEDCCNHFKLNGTQRYFKEFLMQRVYKPPPAVKPPKKPPTHVRTLMDTEDAVDAKKKK